MPEAALRQQRLAMLLIWLVPALWAVNFIVARKAPGLIGPYQLALGRWAVAGLVLVLLSARQLWRQRDHLRQTWWQYLVLGACGMLVCGAWVYEGARSTSAMNMALIYAAAPVLIGVGSVWWLAERFATRQVVGLLLAAAGVVHVVVQGRWASLGQVQFVVGDLWITAAMVCWAAYAVLQKYWRSPLDSTARLAAICIGGVAVLLPGALWELYQPGPSVWNADAMLLVLVAALLPGLGAYWLYGWAQRVVGASRVAVTLYLTPLYAALAGWWVLGELPGWHHAAGAALVLPGVFLVTQGQAPVRPPPAIRS